MNSICGMRSRYRAINSDPADACSIDASGLAGSSMQ